MQVKGFYVAHNQRKPEEMPDFQEDSWILLLILKSSQTFVIPSFFF